MKLKLDADGHAVLTNGNPTYVYDDGREAAIDVAEMAQRLTSTNYESMERRKKLDALETQIKAFEGVDPAAARKALDTVKNLDDKRLIDAGEVERVKSETARAYEVKLSDSEKRYKDLEGVFYAEKVGGEFARSKFIAEKVAVPADMFQATFGRHFKVDNGRVVAQDVNGQPIFSRAKPGEHAGFDEACEILVSQYPYRDNILKGSGSSGSGTQGGGTGANGKRLLTPAEFDKMTPKDRAAAMASGATIKE